MRLVKCEREDMCKFRRSKNLILLEEFIESDMNCAMIEDWTHSSATSCATSLNSSIKRYKFGAISAVVRKGKVYLIKE